MDADLTAGIWSQPLRWPDDQPFSNGHWREPFVFFARAADELARCAPTDIDQPRGWAAQRLIEARIDGNLTTLLLYPDGSCIDLPTELWSAEEVAADYIVTCGSCQDSCDRLWLFVGRRGLNSLVAKATPIGHSRAAPQLKMAVRNEKERTARASLEQLAREVGDDASKAPKRDGWIGESGLGPSLGRKVWDAVARDFPILSTKRKPRKKRDGVNGVRSAVS